MENRSADHSYSTERAHEASEDQGIIVATSSKSAIDLDKEFQNNNPEAKPDEDYEADVTCATPVKYVMQKWCCKRKRQVRYQIGSDLINEFDERRLIDARFWIFIGNLSNLMY